MRNGRHQQRPYTHIQEQLLSDEQLLLSIKPLLITIPFLCCMLAVMLAPAVTIRGEKERSIEMAMERTHNDPITYEIAAHLAVISHKQDGWNKELNLVSWNGQEPPKFDIREWAPDHTKMSRGITLFDAEMKKVCRAYTRFCNARVVSEGINNRNAAAEAGMRAGQEAARMQAEAEEDARARTAGNTYTSGHQDEAYQDVPGEADDFDAPGLEGAKEDPETKGAGEQESGASEQYASLNDEGVVPAQDEASSGAEEEEEA